VPRNLFSVFVLVAVLIACALGARHYFSGEQVLRRQLFEAVESFKNEKILGVLAKVSRSYDDRWGGSYESLGAHVQSIMDAYDGLTVDLEILALEVGEGEASMALTFVVGGRTQVGRGAILGSEAEPCRATLRWAKEEPGWRLVETEELDIPELRDELERRREG
jgi:hypothetical protein